MSIDIAPGLIIGIVVIFLILINAGILISFFRNKNNGKESIYGKLISGTKSGFHKDKDNIDKLSNLLSKLEENNQEK